MNNQKVPKKQTHPRQEAGILSILTYCWTLPTFIKGMRKDLEEADLFRPLDEHTSSTLGDKLEESWRKENQSHQNPSLLRALGRVFGLELMTFGFVLMFMELILKMSQPLALSQLLRYYTDKDNKIERSEALMYASIIVGACFGYALVAHWYSLGLQHFGMKMRVACCSLIYRKSLRVSKSAIGETSIGQMVNLLSNDVNRFDQAAVHLHSLWFVPIETAIIVYILYRILGITSAVGVLTMTLFVPLQVYLGRKIANLRLKTALKTDDRIQLMNEIIAGFQVIKMYTWEKQFVKLVAIARRLEIDKIRAASYIRGAMLSFSIFTTRFAVFSTIVVYVTLGNDLAAEYVFVLISFYNILRQAITRYYPQGIMQIGEARVSISRIQKFLLYEEIDSDTQIVDIRQTINCNNMKCLQNSDVTMGVTFRNVSAKWSSSSSSKTLSNINLNVQQGELVAITGPVGGGKTSLLLAILNELPIQKGATIVNGKISYASQEPWLFAGSIRQNILFAQTMNRERYKKVISVCELEQDFSVLPFGDATIVGERGVTLSGGQKARVSLARAIYQEADIYLLDDPLSAVDGQVGRKLVENCISNFLKHKCTILVTHQLEHLRDFHQIFIMENGKVTGVTYEKLHKLGVISTNLHKTKQALPNDENKSKGFETYSVENHQTSIEIKEQRSFGTIASDVYASYFRAGGSLVLAFFVFCMFLFTQLFASAADYFIAYWVNLEKRRLDANSNDTHDDFTYLPRDICIYAYTALIFTTVLVTLVRSFSFFRYCMEASTKLHNDMVSNIIYVAMNFFHKNSSGRILNRFSKDMGSIDESLPSVVMDCIQIGLTVVGVTIVVSLVNPWLLAVTCIILSIFYALRVVYLATSRSVKRLEAITRSPVFAHMSASLQGLTTIRAFGAEQALQREFDDHQDLHSSAWYLFLSCTRAFGFWLDMICASYIGIITFSFLYMDNEQRGGNVGLAITQAISLTGLFQWGMRQWSELENQMTSVERVAEFTKLEREADRGDLTPAPSWPEKGKIDFKSVSLKYSTTEAYVLKQLTISIKSNEKIGIVGRTGAGKTSLICALFQLTAIDGAILIDGIDITQVPLQTLRSKISIIPQEPFLLSGTLRKNLDPFEEYTDADLWNSLAEVELKKAVAALPSGLDEGISEGGSNFSVGQRQLICLARAIIRGNKILVMDEATASLDAQTDALIQATIRRKFVDCTVLTIAHRLHTVMDSDKVLVMDSGSVVEFGNPHVLLKDENSLFYTMVHQTG